MRRERDGIEISTSYKICKLAFNAKYEQAKWIWYTCIDSESQVAIMKLEGGTERKWNNIENGPKQYIQDIVIKFE